MLKNVRWLWWNTFFQSLIPAYVIERLFWQQRGMSVQMVVVCEILYALTVMVCEVPSGVLADRVGRKKLLVLSNLLGVCELSILLFADSLWQFALSVTLAGISKALASGSQNALLYDTLLYENCPERFEKLLGRNAAIDFTGSLTAALSGGLLANSFGFSMNYFLSICSMAAAFGFTLMLREPPMSVQEKRVEREKEKGYMAQALKIFQTRPLLLIYSLTGAVLGACMNYLDEFWQIVLDTIEVPVVFFGLVSAASLTCRIPGSLLAYKLKERIGRRRILGCILVVDGLSYLLICFSQNLLCLVPILVIPLLDGLVEPLVLGYLHQHTQSAVRATAESLSSLLLRMVSAGVGLLFGIFSDRYSIFAGFCVLGAFCLGYLLLETLLRRHMSGCSPREEK